MTELITDNTTCTHQLIHVHRRNSRFTLRIDVNDPPRPGDRGTADDADEDEDDDDDGAGGVGTAPPSPPTLLLLLMLLSRKVQRRAVDHDAAPASAALDAYRCPPVCRRTTIERKVDKPLT